MGFTREPFVSSDGIVGRTGVCPRGSNWRLVEKGSLEIMLRPALFCSAAALALGSPVLAHDDRGESASEATDIFARDIAEDEAGSPDTRSAILVSASRDSRPVLAGNYPGSVTVIDQAVIERRQVRDVADILRDVPGVAVSSVAGQTQLRLRGSEANHVLVLVDGIEVSDPFAGEFDLTALQAEIGSRIEVLRGPQSALYGSDAIGGVVAYLPGEFDGLGARVEGGTHGTANAALRAGHSGNGWSGSFSAGVVSSDGAPNARGGTRDIGRDSYSVAGRASLDLAPNLALRTSARWIRTEGDFNDQDFDPASPTFGLVVDSPGTRFASEGIYALAGLHLALLDGRWTHDSSVQLADIDRDSFGPFGRTFGSEGERIKASHVSALAFAGGGIDHTVTFAADWEEERYRNTDPFGFAFTGTRITENIGLVGEYRIAGEGYSASAALRRDLNDRFADATTFRIAAGIDLSPGTRLRGAVGSGIKNPGFYELFGFVDGRFIGNADLRPERSTGWEIGVDQQVLRGAAGLSATYFHADLEDEIFTSFPAPNFVATPGNSDTTSKRRGLELSAHASPLAGIQINASYTYLVSEEGAATEVRRPRHVASAALAWTAADQSASLSLVVRHNGEAQDFAFTDPSFVPVPVTLDDYTLVNLYGEARLSEGLRLFARAENLADRRYEQVFSFVSQGRSFVAGIGARF